MTVVGKCLGWIGKLLIAIGIWGLIIGGLLMLAIKMPGTSFTGAPTPLSPEEIELSGRLRNHVRMLSKEIGERNWRRYKALDQARAYIESEFKALNLEVRSIPYPFRGDTFYNVEAVRKGKTASRPDIVVGAHYDSVEGSPGANDNATGVAALIELARLVSREEPETTIRFVAFANEEPPFFDTGEGMGSIAYVRSFKNPKAAIQCMFSLETIGYYSDRPNSQEYPPGISRFYPDQGNFIAFVGNTASRRLLLKVITDFRLCATIPSEGAALPEFVPGIDLSDQRSFWEVGIPALMITDTAFYRDPDYHLPTDTPERLDYEKMTRVITAFSAALRRLDKGY